MCSRPLCLTVLALALLTFFGCSNSSNGTPAPTGRATRSAKVFTATPGGEGQTAEPEDTPEPTPTQGPLFIEYTVRSGDTLGAIAARNNLAIEDIMQLNQMSDPNSLQIGQVLKIPASVARVGPDNQLIPDSELVYGPTYKDFNVQEIADKYGGYLASYQENVEGTPLTGPQIVQLVAQRFSVGPRVLLALLEMQGGWVTSSALGQERLDYPLGYPDPSHVGLYKQLSWGANQLNAGYYGKLSGKLNILTFHDKQRARLAYSLNPGTAAIHNMLAQTTTYDDYLKLVAPDGFTATYQKLFGDPYAHEFKPLIPRDLQQPPFILPLENGKLWYLTGGPHAGWVDGSPWAAVDFAPADQAGSCWPSAYWAIAAGPGRIVESGKGRVVEDLDGDNFPGTGWSLLYMHMADDERVDVGTEVKTGDHIGHPSCVGGEAQTSHVHFARLYNGQWLSAGDQRVPMVISGWTFHEEDQEYDGTMTRGSETREANNMRVLEQNGVIADSGHPAIGKDP